VHDHPDVFERVIDGIVHRIRDGVGIFDYNVARDLDVHAEVELFSDCSAITLSISSTPLIPRAMSSILR